MTGAETIFSANLGDKHEFQVSKVRCSINIVVEALRARDEVSKGTVPVLQFLCDQCRAILSVTLDPEWQAQIVAGQLRTVGQGPTTSH
jgi:hypothetical protein